ncbi:MAG: Kdo hydroxylase family protein, partial [Acetobacteraceae bacterium]|nr:Kdo hydroxylase family protein [Acetobacteraceae bacterium]
MTEADVQEMFDIGTWTGPFDPEMQRRALAALEAGRVVFFPRLSFALSPGEARFLAPEVAGKSKNISVDPKTRQCQGTALTGKDAQLLAAMIDRFGRCATSLVQALFPQYAVALERARTSFRPVEIAGRSYSARQDDRRLHVDAFPTRPMRGRRILRLFTNVAPDETDRLWEIGEPFEPFARHFLPKLRRPLAGSAWVMDRLGLTKGRRSRYDEMMLGLHDAGKLDETYQSQAPRAALRFPPGSTWIVYTDQALHAALG